MLHHISESTMGVKGLLGFLSKDENTVNFDDYELHNRRVVFDGNNVVYSLYDESGLAKLFGGENMAFAVFIEKFINKLRKCAIEPIFVFDGIHDVSPFLHFLFVQATSYTGLNCILTIDPKCL